MNWERRAGGCGGSGARVAILWEQPLLAVPLRLCPGLNGQPRVAVPHWCFSIPRRKMAGTAKFIERFLRSVGPCFDFPDYSSRQSYWPV